MGRKLARTVTLQDDSGTFVTLRRGDEPDEDMAERITNPAAWQPEEPGKDRADGGAWPPDGGFDSMADEEIFAAANSTSLQLDTDDVSTQKESGSYSPKSTYNSATIPALRQMAAERDLDTSGLTRKQELIDLLTEDDADN